MQAKNNNFEHNLWQLNGSDFWPAVYLSKKSTISDSFFPPLKLPNSVKFYDQPPQVAGTLQRPGGLKCSTRRFLSQRYGFETRLSPSFVSKKCLLILVLFSMFPIHATEFCDTRVHMSICKRNRLERSGIVR